MLLDPAHISIPSRSAWRVQLCYPILTHPKGIVYFATHRDLWRPLMSRLVPTLSLSAGVIAFMFIFTYLPQAAVLALFNGPLAAFSAILLTLSESSTIINLLSKNFLIDEALLDTFDGVGLFTAIMCSINRLRRIRLSCREI